MMKRWKKQAGMLLGSALLGTSLFVLPAGRAEAVDAWAVAAQSLGVLAAYKSSLASILAMGNDVNAQVASARQDRQENGLDDNEHDVRIVNKVMQQLVTQGRYVLKANSLPFIWGVNNSNEFNASCFPTDYISINRALVRGLECDEDELAAVLGHEMTHGIEQHSARNYAKAVAQYYGMSFLNMDAGLMDWNKLNALASYSIAKNVTLPTEYEADEGGFYIMTSAGFNPGGPAAVMYRMAYYLTYETKNVLEYQDLDEKNKNQENFSDHPETELREQRLAKMMTDYGCGHVTVRDRKNVLIDGQELLTADWTRDDYDNTVENAYYTAGGLAKAFHDYDSPDSWNFRPDGEGGVDFLDDSRVYAVLRDAVRSRGLGSKLEQMVRAAYAGEAQSGARAAMRQEEAQREASFAAVQQDVQAADAKAVKKMRENGDAYSDYGMGRQALWEFSRVFASKNMDDEAESYVMRGRAKAVEGDYAGALADANRGVALDGKNAYNFLNRADIYRMAGNREAALSDCASAKKVDAENPFSYLISAEIEDEQGNKDAALKEYQAFYKLRPAAFRRIPPEYLQKISAKDYKTWQKEKAEARDKARKAKK
ncbi:M48 family metallopeptidase [Mitsuokella sp. AF33-22]|uniref:M48 family metallopeptidase n=1 Tax=Mitsuokella sp. AF33-22 TaxID=2292047 RepID=UPI001F40C20C|nr:M48 family metallopeptidase [Mitsuokella sp. AF33-22]